MMVSKALIIGLMHFSLSPLTGKLAQQSFVSAGDICEPSIP